VRRLILIFATLLTGCTSGVDVEHRRATQDDTPFGGGFAPSHYPNGDPFDSASRRNEIRLRARGPLEGPAN
jgi:hypothetical protein